MAIVDSQDPLNRPSLGLRERGREGGRERGRERGREGGGREGGRGRERGREGERERKKVEGERGRREGGRRRGRERDSVNTPCMYVHVYTDCRLYTCTIVHLRSVHPQKSRHNFLISSSNSKFPTPHTCT